LKTVDISYTCTQKVCISSQKCIHLFEFKKTDVMVVPKKFNDWKEDAYLPLGSKIRAYHMYRNFVDSCNGSFKQLPKKFFYDWVRSEFDGVREGRDERGLWFMIGDKVVGVDQKINRYQLRAMTCKEFVEWLDNRYDSMLYSKVHSSMIKDEFIGFLGKSGERTSFMTKQLFNKWLKMGVNSKGGSMIDGRDSIGKYIIIT
jgi:hypothetical protein